MEKKVEQKNYRHLYTTVYFQNGQTMPTSESRKWIEELAATLKTSSFLKVRILVQGYTDNVGPENYNQHLSEQRASSIRSILVQGGISPDRVEREGRGEDDPVADNQSKQGRMLNRVVEMLLT